MTDADGTTARAILRADARRNEARVLDGAREAFAQYGFEVSYHDIARMAGVGVGTVYRRFPDRDALVEAVLLDILSGLAGDAVLAAASDDAWTAFERFFRSLADRMHRHAGLSSQVSMPSDARIGTARAELLTAVERLCQRAAPCLLAGIGWEDVVYLAQLTGTTGCGLGVKVTEKRRQLAIETVLKGMQRTC